MKRQKNKEPSLIRQIITIQYEQAKRRRALRYLAKAEWSMEFLSAVLVHASNVLDKNVYIEVETRSGHKMKLSSVKAHGEQLDIDNDIFNHLDDVAAVQQFIRENNRRG